jgi:hypothetical protein
VQGWALVVLFIKRLVANIVVFGLLAVEGYVIFLTIRSAAFSTVVVNGCAPTAAADPVHNAHIEI